MDICMERGADLYIAKLMPLPLTVSCFSKIQIGFTFLVPAHLGSPGKRAIKRGCVCVCVLAVSVAKNRNYFKKYKLRETLLAVPECIELLSSEWKWKLFFIIMHCQN